MRNTYLDVQDDFKKKQGLVKATSYTEAQINSFIQRALDAERDLENMATRYNRLQESFVALSLQKHK